MNEMNSNKFIELQFMTLRKEIEDCKNRVFQITLGTSTIVPGILILAIENKLGFVILLLPFAVFILILIFTYEEYCIMRCGGYIRIMIEPYVNIEKITGWESWLEKDNIYIPYNIYTPRAGEKYLKHGFYFMAMFYYLCLSILAMRYAYSLFDQHKEFFSRCLFIIF